MRSMIALMRPARVLLRCAPGPRPVAFLLTLLAVALLTLPGAAGAQEIASVPATGAGHGWSIVRTGPERRPALVHLPPRSGENAVEPGTVRFAAWLNDEPEWLGGWGNRVYLAFRPEAGPDGRLRRHIVSMSATPLVAGIWENHPMGRFRVHPALPGEGILIGFVGMHTGAAALLRVGEAGDVGEELRLLVLHRNKWVQVDHPWMGEAAAPLDSGDRVHLVAMPDGPALVVERTAGDGSVWTARLTESADGEIGAAWEEQVIIDGGAGTGGASVLALDGQILRHRHVEGAGRVLELLRPGPGGGVFEVARYEDVPGDATIVPMRGAGTLVMMWNEGDGDKAASRGGHVIREVSAFSGRVWHTGTGSSGGLVQTRQFQILAVALVVIMATVLLFIVRPGEQAASLPAGMAVAEPGRRIAAAGADFLLGVMLSSVITGISGSEMLSPVVLMGSKGAAGALLLAFWLTFAHSTASEWLFGRSLGKAMAGCEVVRVQRVPVRVGGTGGEEEEGTTLAMMATPQRPLLWQAAARNAVRWGLPPLALWLLADPSSRHPGDLLARTVVVVRGEPGVEEAGGSPPKDRGGPGEG